jgi:phage terminase large subunit-like protein
LTLPGWTTACPDWETRLAGGGGIIPPPLFPSEAEAALDCFRALRIVDVMGQPTFGQASRPWVLDFAAAIFGALDPETGRRLIREYLLLISKKNGKSTLAAGIMLTALLRNWRQSAEFLILAPTLEVANNSFFPARDMVNADPELKDILHPQEHLKTITHRLTGATLKVVAANNNTVSGKKATGVLVDELWLLGKRLDAQNMLVEATGGMVSRPEGFVIYLTTHSDAPPAGVYKQKLEYFRDVRDGVIEDKRSLPVLFEFPSRMLKAKSYLDPKNWALTNPNLGLSVDPDWIAGKLAENQRAGEGATRVFLAKHLNVEIGGNLRQDAWPGAEFWQRRADPKLTLQTLIARSEVIVIGLDGGGLDDLFGLAVLGRETGTGRWLCWTHAFARISMLRRRKSEATRLIDFAKDGDITVVDGEGAIPWDLIAIAMETEVEMPPPEPDENGEMALPPDIAGIVDICVEVDQSGKLAKVGVDPAGIGAVVDALAKYEIWDEAGDGSGRVTGVSQGYKLMGAIKTIERKLDDGTFFHPGQPMMAWCVGNAKTELRGNAVMITKQSSGTGKIDPLMAAFNTGALMSMNPEPPNGGPSIYEDRGITVV